MSVNSSLFTIIYLKKEKKFLLFDNAIFGYAYFKNYRINLLNGKKESVGISFFSEQLESIKISDNYNHPRFINLHYEYALKESVDDKCLLAIDVEFSSVKTFCHLGRQISIMLKPINHISYKEYKRRFDHVYENLLDGNSYQVNLTSNFNFHIKNKNPFDFINSLWANKENRGEYSHTFYSQCLDRLLLSNSPECLFSYSPAQKKIYTMPIKGTIEAGTNLQKSWGKLINSKKDQAELFMITDLMRNDLTQMELRPSKVIAQKKYLKVPLLIHSYSLLSVDVSPHLTLGKVISSLFPGGSITGAPKKRTMQIIKDTEKEVRGFYCGSTIIMHKSLVAGSINIRSADICFSRMNFSYGSGGGITLLSTPYSEYKESLSKLSSFIKNFQQP